MTTDMYQDKQVKKQGSIQPQDKSNKNKETGKEQGNKASQGGHGRTAANQPSKNFSNK